MNAWPLGWGGSETGQNVLRRTERRPCLHRGHLLDRTSNQTTQRVTQCVRRRGTGKQSPSPVPEASRKGLLRGHLGGGWTKRGRCVRGECVFLSEGAGGGRRKRNESRRNNTSEGRNSISKGPRKGTVYSWSYQFFWKAVGEEDSWKRQGETVSSPRRHLS